MTNEAQLILQQALLLSAEDREMIAVELMNRLPSDEAKEVQAAWHAEIERRAASSDAGELESAPLDEAWPRIVGNNGS